MLFEKVEKSRIITFYFNTSTVDVGECRLYSPSSTSQNSTVKW